MEEIDIEAAKSLDPEYLWPEHASSEGEEPVDELGEWLAKYCTDNMTSLY